nr:MAG TPA: hypothetical protein [Caudoviricetes sp.]
MAFWPILLCVSVRLFSILLIYLTKKGVKIY